MTLHDMLAELAALCGFPGLALDAQRSAAATRGGLHIELCASADGSMLEMAAAIGTLRTGCEQALVVELLRLNAALLGPCAPCFALSRPTREVLLTAALPVDQLTAQAAREAILQWLDSVATAKDALGDAVLQMA